MKITILSRVDYAGSGFKMYEALLQHTNHDVECYTGKGPNRFDIERGKIIREENIKIAQDRVDSSDIIHLKGDWPHDGTYLGLTLPNKPIVVTVSGSLFRLSKDGGRERYSFDQYDNCSVKTAFSPDLCYPDFTDLWIPHPIQTEDYPLLWKQSDVPLLVHSPTSRDMKDSAFIFNVFSKIDQQIKCRFDLIEDVPFTEAERRSRDATIFFDQFKVGFYGNSAIQAMRYGIPVASWIRPSLLKRDDMKGCPVLTWKKDASLWADKIVEMLSNDMTGLSLRTRTWCDHTHSYLSVATKLTKIYEDCIKG